MPEENPIIPEELDPLLTFVKDLLGFAGSGGDSLISPLITSAEHYLQTAGVAKPEVSEEPSTEELGYEAQYNLAVAVRVKIIHDGDPKGDLERTLTGIILQIRRYGGGGNEV